MRHYIYNTLVYRFSICTISDHGTQYSNIHAKKFVDYAYMEMDQFLHLEATDSQTNTFFLIDILQAPQFPTLLKILQYVL